MNSPELKEHRMAGTSPLKVFRLAPILLREAALKPAPKVANPADVRAAVTRAVVRAEVKRGMAAIVAEVLEETRNEREARAAIAAAGRDLEKMNAAASRHVEKLVKSGMDQQTAGRIVGDAMQKEIQ